MGDHTAEYTFLLGTRVSNIDNVPEGMIAKRIPAACCAEVQAERGPVQKVVVDAWQRIWAASAEELGGEYAFVTDFEIYGEQATDPRNAQVSIFIGLQ